MCNVKHNTFSSFMKVAIKTVYLEKTAMNHALATVTLTHVIYRMDPVLDVSLDGRELHVTEAGILNIYELTKRTGSIKLMYWKYFFWLHFRFEQNVVMDHMVWIVIKTVLESVKIMLLVIIWLLCVTEAVLLDGMAHIVTKVMIAVPLNYEEVVW